MAGGGRAGRPTKKKGPTKGSGGHRRKGLEGRGPTPPAHMRHWYKERQRAAEAERSAAPPAQRRRREEGSEVMGGRNPVVEALRAGVPARTLYIAHRIDSDERVREAIKLAADQNVALLEVSRDTLDRLTDGTAHQGLALQLPPYEYAHPEDLVSAARRAGEKPLIIALDGVTDPRNLGAIARSATAFGAHGLLVPSRRAAGVTAAAWKTSAGTLATMPVARAANLTSALRGYRKAGLFIIGLDGEARTDLADADLVTEPLVIVVGSEGKGLSRLVRETCDMVVRIPMRPAAESLNAGVATGIALYEVDRRRSNSA
ncbi:23S rRNA (guanosine(2251)-2'-O)-methyltransferase RlmB [Thermostaphylospora chromogena]|uniref:23S rRNA (Guanosine2251-2'-O)-methyltransferase n=1 Tax=Thermostaphylospora chromogena TaxID=35622 RepID=A0A1H1E0D6_9ACTN|nr:23S rRNA (guanosine(2251)-2'-O)-methyltransferase RlmB [Thermostaphylospora chromogena]SDQ81596.1 23S rRNA (guanosine2251-2'-O)-methyltransferase [Thermostaphylospora chromogena]